MITMQEQVVLAPYTTFKIGGPARYFVAVKTPEECAEAVAFAREKQLQWFVLGGGSDLLISDKGFNGVVIKSELNEITFDESVATVTAGSGTRLSRIVTAAAQKGLSGLEFSIGVPASVGGAVWANLGARGRETKDVLVSVRVMDADGKQRTMKPEECEFAYRESIFKHHKMVILEATFQLQREEPTVIKQRVQELSQLRKDTQDVGSKCAGCVFRNPKNQTDLAAAKLIDDLGLKGLTIGGAQVSPIHANFVINTGNATAEDVIILISLIKQKVRDTNGVQLMEEIEYVGFNE
jgi:UDP-N-acetylmuramate dehydrogenase